MQSHLAKLRRLAALCVLGMFLFTLIAKAIGLVTASSLYQVEAFQWIPALLGSLNGKEGAWVILSVWVVVTLLAGRTYCSWMCPLGILQDIVIRLAHPHHAKRKGATIRYTPNHWIWRTLSALLSFGSLALGCVFILSWWDPYTLTARFCSAILHPLAAQLSAWVGMDVEPDWNRYAPTLLLAACISLLIPLAMAFWRGRLYCNTLCPVGAVLGLISRWAPFTPHFRPGACKRCAACMRACKAHAIDLKAMRIDTSRCIACYDCLEECAGGGITLLPSPKKAGIEPISPTKAEPGRRAFLGLGMTSLATALWPDPILPEIAQNPSATGNNTAAAAIPPGGKSVDRFLERCTGCGLCITVCPTHTLHPSLTAHGWSGIMKPYLNYAAGFCDYTCRQCSTVCPEGALLPLSLAEKQRTQIALAQFDAHSCRV